MAQLTLSKLTKNFSVDAGTEVSAVKDVDLVVNDREFMVLVGPRGSGKSTTLRMVAGLDHISGGTVAIDGRVMNEVPPQDRDIAMVFKNYALYPNLSVYENLATELEFKKVPRAEIKSRIHEAAELLGLEPLLRRKPPILSCDQRQRVAVARAIVRRPKVFLFDETLSELDLTTRDSMRREISKLHTRLGATMIYVTHDHVEAMTMGNRICVMNGGVIQQVAPSAELYARPANLFVAGFIGNPVMNFFRGVLRYAGGDFVFAEENTSLSALVVRLPATLGARVATLVGQRIWLGVRPEDIRPGFDVEALERTTAVIDAVEHPGTETLLYLNTGATVFTARVPVSDRFAAGQRLSLTFSSDALHLFDATTEQAL
jgi:multiple sugar transport system ATP-binding protein